MRVSQTDAGYAAAVFDLDGVVTRTERLHAAAWKDLFDGYLRSREARFGEAFEPFCDANYVAYVDGRPRYDGVRTFLTSRGITLDDGAPDDPPDRETVAGLGNRKNRTFQRLLRERGPEVDQEAVRLIRELRRSGLRVGMASSSRNAEAVLRSAGLADLFDVRVDGVLAARLRLRGKPSPDIFLECLAQLGGEAPDHTILVEDAVAGVEAGRTGGFGLVLGVDRGGRGIELREHGADWIVHDFGELTVDRIRTYFENREHVRPNALAHWAKLMRELQSRRPALFLDYDGTLTPIVSRPELATLGREMREVIRRLAAAWPTIVVSGRKREDVQALVGVAGIHYAGSHGFDISGPGAGGLRHEVDPGLVPRVAEAARELRARTAGIPGVLVEDKTYAVAVHYRLVAEDRVAEVEGTVEQALAGRPELRKTLGKKVFELRPSMPWDKGRAVLWLLEALGLDRPEVIPVYIGDDVTDEDAFRALEDHGVAVLVSELPHPTAARYALQDIGEVRELLGRVAALGRRGTP